MKFKIISLVLMLCALITGVIASDPVVEVGKENPISNFISNIFSGQGFYVTGGTLSENEVAHGDKLDAEVKVKFQFPGDKYRLKMYFVKDYYSSNPKFVKITEKTYNYPHDEGDWIKAKVRNIDTDVLPETDSWCGKDIKVAGIHQTYVSNADLIDLPGFTSYKGGWVTDYIGDEDDKRRLNEDFKLLCDNFDCNLKDSQPYCSNADTIRQKTVDTDDCSYNEIILERCDDGEYCQDATCVKNKDKDTCDKFIDRCQDDNTIVTICEDNYNDYSVKDCQSGYVCDDGECVNDNPVEEKINVWIIDEGTCEKRNVPESESGKEGYFESEGNCNEVLEVLLYEGDDTEAGNETGDGNENTEKTLKDYLKEAFDYKNNTAVAITFTTMLSLIGILLIYLIIPQKTWKKVFKL